jgi:hypothetical protein
VLSRVHCGGWSDTGRRLWDGLRILLGLLGFLAVLGCVPFGDPGGHPYPVMYPAIAAYLDDGRATVLLRPCPQDFVLWIELTQMDPVTPGPSPFDHPFANPGIWRLVNSGHSSVPAQLRLLEDPPGWTEATLQVRPVTYMLDEERYTIALSGSFNASGIPTPDHGLDSIAFLNFTMENLRSLADGQVWAETDGFKAKPTTRDAFAASADAVCSDPLRFAPRAS